MLKRDKTPGAVPSSTAELKANMVYSGPRHRLHQSCVDICSLGFVLTKQQTDMSENIRSLVEFKKELLSDDEWFDTP